VQDNASQAVALPSAPYRRFGRTLRDALRAISIPMPRLASGTRMNGVALLELGDRCPALEMYVRPVVRHGIWTLANEVRHVRQRSPYS